MTTLLIADDHFAVRLGLEMMSREILGTQCSIEHAANGQQVLAKLRSTIYDSMMLDMQMPEPSGLHLLETALSLQPNLNILVVSVNPESVFAEKCLQLGAKGFVAKSASDTELKTAIEKVIAGQRYLPPGMLGSGEEIMAPNPFHSLSVRELDVTLLLLKGQGMLEVGRSLGISASTASTFKGRIFRKLKIQSILELEQLARFHGVSNDAARS
ncbi:MAG: response regulator transcription factor [Candidatus Pseudobacter hemicellulosilyticus]|uniref:Response regulator transcription factor n=1 Tax=Candidatus Pseudobacter hemicellulosilyticus TaxID=3121375 RepID=A0AAJ6BIJ9_9BACT|nr:MAG: response regulator transcription factor [Pseudobacter sp.]